MKKLVVIAIIGIAFCYGGPRGVYGALFSGTGRYGISENDPLGSFEKLHAALMDSGFVGDSGRIGTPRTVRYTHSGDAALYPDFKPGSIEIVVGDDEYVQSVRGVFLGSQHAPSPGRMTPTEQIASGLWRALSSSKPVFERKVVGQQKFGMPGGLGKAAITNITDSVATFSERDVTGEWRYSDDTPMEIIQLKLR